MARVICNGDNPLDNQCNQLFKEGTQPPGITQGVLLGGGGVKPNSFKKYVNLKLSVAMENVTTT